MLKRIKNNAILFVVTIFLGLALIAPSVDAETLFTDDFESGDLTHTENGISWGGSKSTDVSTDRPRSGSYSLRFHFDGDTDPAANAIAEQRFFSDSEIDDIYIRYYIYFPTDYEHRDGESTNNNKLIRIWSDDSDGPSAPHRAKQGASFYPGNVSDLTPEGYKSGYGKDVIWDYDGGMGPLYNADWGDQWSLSSNDLGRWICFEWHFSPDPGDGSGAFEFWVDGVKQFGTTGHSVANAPPPRAWFKNGYLMGASNSGFDNDTYIYIDDIVMSDSYIGPKSDNTEQGELPAPSNVKVAELK